MRFSFCPDCGAPLGARPIGDEGLVPYCEACQKPWFSVSHPCVICLLTDGAGQLALIEQTYGRRGFKCVAGFLKAGETAEDCAKREVLEETGLTVRALRYVRSWFHERGDNLMLGFVCRVQREDFRLSGEVASARWFTPTEALEALREASIALALAQEVIAGDFGE